jgi:hypothetical protein
MRSTQIADHGLESAERAPTRFAEGGLNGAGWLRRRIANSARVE